MCGIAGYTGKQEAISKVITSLKRLEHRGYDSCGIAFTKEEVLCVVKTVGGINKLCNELKIDTDKTCPVICIGHTRWATHGKVSVENAHPHVDCANRIAVVHNGIIENYQELKKFLLLNKHNFISATDTEVIPHLIEHFLMEGKTDEQAFFDTIKKIRGSFAVVAIFTHDNRIFFAQKNSSLLVYKNNEGTCLISDPVGLPEEATSVFAVNDGEWGVVSPDHILLYDNKGNERSLKNVSYLKNSNNETQHFFIKEILEQSSVVVSSLRSVISFFERTGNNFFEGINKILITGCGSSYHAALIGRYYFETIALIDTNVELASELSSCRMYNKKNTLVIALSQSGETRDTVSAVKKFDTAETLAITNVENSLLTRLTSHHILMLAGPEISVAATKSFTAQVVCLYVISLIAAFSRRAISAEKKNEMIVDVLKLSGVSEKIFSLASQLKNISKFLKDSHTIFILGRGINYPVALEAALKLKEVSGVHAEGLSSAEMKHGPIALISETTPVFFIAPMDETYEKTLNNIEEIKARGGKTFVITTENNQDIKQICDNVICIPDSKKLSPICSVIPFQLLSYFLALEKNLPVDRPRNLAKTVTVE